MDNLPNYLRMLIEYNNKPERTVIGLHSGTSTDGPTAMVASVSGVGASATIRPIVHETYPYPEDLRRALLDVMERETGFIDRVAQGDMAVGAFLADVAGRIARKANLALSDIDLICSSGQISYGVAKGQREEHRWIGGEEITCQTDLGEGAVIAERTGVTTVSSFRRRDNSVGGLGSPLVPFGDWVNFRSATEDRVVWNIGGIANATVLPANCGIDGVWAFDSGPGNMVVDALVRVHTDGKLEYDVGGTIAAGGNVSEVLLSELMRGDFIQGPPPKAATRQVFGRDYSFNVQRRSKELGLSLPDAIATATALTAASMAHAYNQFIRPKVAVREMIVAGGGVHNRTMLQMLREKMAPVRILESSELGIDPECREVMAMIAVGNQTVQGQPGNAPKATGASRGVILGHIDIASGDAR
jgi:anhydro-N-acetylmuramic acid kinase